MCFSPEASFAVGAALVPAGGYCLRAAGRRAPRLLPLALVPVLLGAQQISEGFVWVALEAGDARAARPPALVFLFFALAFWPFWLGVVATAAETRPGRRALLAVLAALASGWFGVLYLPLAADPGGLDPAVVGHSIRYAFQVPLDAVVPRGATRGLYLVSIVAPLAIGPRLIGPGPGLLLLGAAAVAMAAFEHAFASVWCFFAAALSLCLVRVFYALPGRPDRGPPNGGARA